MTEMLLVVVLGGRRAALPAAEVNAVIELTEVTPVPRTAAHVVGLAALHSRPLTVIDCSAALGVGQAGADWRTRRAVVVQHDGHLYALLVDGADNIVAGQGEPVPLGADPGPGWERVALGRVETEAGAMPLLDIAALIAGPKTSTNEVLAA
jgi:purine-binding chemotaxis protein CheW